VRKETLLHEVINSKIVKNKLEVIKCMLEKYKMNPNALNFFKSTPLHLLVFKPTCGTEIKGMIQLLLENGADPNIQNTMGQTALHNIIFADEIYEHVYSNTRVKVDFSLKNRDDETILEKHMRGVEFLLQVLESENEKHTRPSSYVFLCEHAIRYSNFTIFKMVLYFAERNGLLKDLMHLMILAQIRRNCEMFNLLCVERAYKLFVLYFLF
jgi:ankyrin repeat protein